jgi:hypothetical protein
MPECGMGDLINADLLGLALVSRAASGLIHLGRCAYYAVFRGVCPRKAAVPIRCQIARNDLSFEVRKKSGQLLGSRMRLGQV